MPNFTSHPILEVLDPYQLDTPSHRLNLIDSQIAHFRVAIEALRFAAQPQVTPYLDDIVTIHPTEKKEKPESKPKRKVRAHKSAVQ